MRNVIVIGPRWGIPEMFSDRGYNVVQKLEDADMVIFTGGEDINPNLYGEKADPTCYWSDRRDADELAVFERAKELGKVFIGICRGGQLLNVLNGGKMWQDVDSHTRAHAMVDLITGQEVWTTSAHHQMMIPAESGSITKVAVSAPIARMKRRQGETRHNDVEDVEVLWYPGNTEAKQVTALCYQGHPEFPGNERGGFVGGREYFFQLVERYCVPAVEQLKKAA